MATDPSKVSIYTERQLRIEAKRIARERGYAGRVIDRGGKRCPNGHAWPTWTWGIRVSARGAVLYVEAECGCGCSDGTSIAL